MEKVEIHTGYVPGCIGRLAELHAAYYHAQAGFGVRFEARVARELAQFCERYDAARDALWLLRADGRVEGSIAIDGHAAADGQGQDAHLRWFILSDGVRGRGHGQALLERAMAFCDDRGYATIHLSTFEGLDAARHLYEKSGFALASQQRGTQWGTEVNEQTFVRRGLIR